MDIQNFNLSQHISINQNITNEQLAKSAIAPIEQVLPWSNWSGNLSFQFDNKDQNYYFIPTQFNQLQAIINQANQLRLEGKKISIRVSGQRHSVSPLVIDQKINQNPDIKTWIIDLSLYADLGENAQQQIKLNPDHTVTVNAGATEEQLDIFLTNHNLMLKTVTAGGFFSIGGMVAVDVHGSAVNQSIFSQNVIAFTILNANGEKITFSKDSGNFDKFNLMQYYRTSLGALGIITSVTLATNERPYKTTLKPSWHYRSIANKQKFINTFNNLIISGDYDSVESFFNPYKFPGVGYGFLTLEWKIDKNPTFKKKNDVENIPSNQDHIKNRQWGAPYLGDTMEKWAENYIQGVQNGGFWLNGQTAITSAFTLSIEPQMTHTMTYHKSMWLTKAPRAMFMSYFIALPENEYHGLDVAWDALQILTKTLNDSSDFILSAPAEFRFVKASDALLSGTYSENPNQRFISIEVVGFTQKTSSDKYPQNLLNFFAKIEKQWIDMKGFPHLGKMYGFYNPEQSSNNISDIKGISPFNQNYMKLFKQRRNTYINTFANYQKQVDPNGLFCNQFLTDLGVCYDK